MALPGVGAMTVPELEQFHFVLLLVALVIHVMMSAVLGLIYGVLLPTLPSVLARSPGRAPRAAAVDGHQLHPHGLHQPGAGAGSELALVHRLAVRLRDRDSRGHHAIRTFHPVLAGLWGRPRRRAA